MSCHCDSQKPFAWLCRLTPELPKMTSASSPCSSSRACVSACRRAISCSLNRKLLPQPVGGQGPVLPRDVVADVVAVVVEDELAARRLLGLPLRLLPRDQPVVAAGDREERLLDQLRRVVEVQLARLRAPLPHRLRAGATTDRHPRPLR